MTVKTFRFAKPHTFLEGRPPRVFFRVAFFFVSSRLLPMREEISSCAGRMRGETSILTEFEYQKKYEIQNWITVNNSKLLSFLHKLSTHKDCGLNCHSYFQYSVCTTFAYIRKKSKCFQSALKLSKLGIYC